MTGIGVAIRGTAEVFLSVKSRYAEVCEWCELQWRLGGQ